MYTKTKPRKWEKQDIERLKELQEKGYNKKEKIGRASCRERV